MKMNCGYSCIIVSAVAKLRPPFSRVCKTRQSQRYRHGYGPKAVIVGCTSVSVRA
jgi:hypothetical protein